jgi:hypothetical protein
VFDDNNKSTPTPVLLLALLFIVALVTYSGSIQGQPTFQLLFIVLVLISMVWMFSRKTNKTFPIEEMSIKHLRQKKKQLGLYLATVSCNSSSPDLLKFAGGQRYEKITGILGYVSGFK